MTRYSPAFESTVAGRLFARFQLEDDGSPSFDKEDGDLFYFIELFLNSPNRDRIADVTYHLDPSYYQPERRRKNRLQDFREVITAYGDFLVKVDIQVGSDRIRQTALLSDLLEEGHPSPTPLIQQAIQYIRAN